MADKAAEWLRSQTMDRDYLMANGQSDYLKLLQDSLSQGGPEGLIAGLQAMFPSSEDVRGAAAKARQQIPLAQAINQAVYSNRSAGDIARELGSGVARQAIEPFKMGWAIASPLVSGAADVAGSAIEGGVSELTGSPFRFKDDATKAEVNAIEQLKAAQEAVIQENLAKEANRSKAIAALTDLASVASNTRPEDMFVAIGNEGIYQGGQKLGPMLEPRSKAENRKISSGEAKNDLGETITQMRFRQLQEQGMRQQLLDAMLKAIINRAGSEMTTPDEFQNLLKQIAEAGHSGAPLLSALQATSSPEEIDAAVKKLGVVK